ncbi:MAG TPA: hypothetical protein VKN18_11590 [Blastocatellia bacterium]|nr:hypothetical protein [Blastocatellia bacterium]
MQSSHGERITNQRYLKWAKAAHELKKAANYAKTHIRANNIDPLTESAFILIRQMVIEYQEIELAVREAAKE